jgi:hypothetical protein
VPEINVEDARIKLAKVVLRYLSSEMDEPNAHYDDELDLCNDMTEEAAKEFVQAMEERRANA